MILINNYSDYKTRTKWCTSSDSELLKQFRDLSADTRIPASRLLDEALKDLLKKYGKITDEK